MNGQTKAQLKSAIDEAKLVSFDVFDTLLFRKTNTPETVFDLVGRHFGIHGFRKLRMDGQNEASRRAYEAYRHPHANMDEIYEVLSEHREIPVDWELVKAYEIQTERDALVANEELLEIFQYAKSQNKRVVATSDMYLSAKLLGEFLEEKGFAGMDYVYCSADEHKAKFNRDLFETVAQKEQVAYEDMLHIGDKERDDVEFPGAYGIKTFLYRTDADMAKIKDAPGSDVDKGIYKILSGKNDDFWYRLGVEVGGPLYMGLYRWLLGKTQNGNRKIFCLSRDGYNLYNLCRNMGHENIEYLYTSRRALTMAAITRMDEQDILSLPPYTVGQTVGELLDYLCVDRADITHLAEAGFRSFEDVIRTEEDKDAFRSLYIFDREVFLARCKQERENALAYFREKGLMDQDAICFDCGWQGSSQELMKRFLNAVGSRSHHEFLYFGIKNSTKSCQQLRGCHYDTYLFDFYKNHSLQVDLDRNVALYELFFSAPHKSVYYYGDGGQVIFEEGCGDPEKNLLLKGICDFVQMGIGFVDTYDVEYTPEISMGHLKRLIHLPTEEEAVTIGNLQNVDGFARKQGQTKYVAYVTREQLDENPNTEIYWLTGLLKRPDVSDEIKRECAAKISLPYPPVVPEYHLEDAQSLRNYHRWLRWEQDHPCQQTELSYKPSFSVVIPVYNTVTEQLEACFRSVLAQTYENYELILVDDHSSWENVRPVLARYASHSRVKVLYRTVNGHISVATNDGIAQANGEFTVFMDCDDTIEPNALYEFAKKLNENPALDFIYSDEDKLTEDGKIRHAPFFKPDWSPDLFMSMMYTNHLATYRTSIVKEVGGLRTAYNGSQDYDFTLRFMEKSHNSRVGHVAKVLYHWRERKESVAYAMSSKNYAAEAARNAKEDYIRRNKIPARLEYIDGMSQYRTVYEVAGNPLVSIIIPSKDHPAVLRQCIDSIRSYTSYSHYEFVVVDNGSNRDNQTVIARYLESVGAKYVYEEEPFNFSRMCNLGAANAEGEYLLFLNDDIEIFQPQWLERLLGHAQQAHVGAVGAKLLYPQSTVIQHVGVSNPEEGPLHSFQGLDDRYPYYFGWNRVDYDCCAVTGACLMVAVDKFREVGGFDEGLPVAYNDVKLCFALHCRGYYNVLRNDAIAYHHESLSRGSDHVEDEKLIRMSKERAGLFAEFEELKADPYLNKNLAGFDRVLSMDRYYDELKPVDLSDCVMTDKVTIDHIEVGKQVRITGWAVLEGETHIEELERYLVIRDPFDNAYCARVQPTERADVARYFDNGNYLMAGYECILRNADFRTDIMPYQMGIMIVDRTDKRHLCWCRWSDVIRQPKPRSFALPDRRLKDFCPQTDWQDVQWYADACSDCGDYHVLRGFAFKRGNDHYRYSKTLILQGKDGFAREYEMYSEERIDVAYTFEQEHFLYYTGYLCYVFHSTLQAGEEYDVIIRLKNQFDSRDVRDIVTGQKVCL